MPNESDATKKEAKVNAIEAITRAYESVKVMASLYEDMNIKEISAALLYVRNTVRLTVE